MGDLTWYPDPDRPGRWLHAQFDGPPPSTPTNLMPAVRPFGDIGDHIDPHVADPTPPEITDPNHPDFVLPWAPQ